MGGEAPAEIGCSACKYLSERRKIARECTETAVTCTAQGTDDLINCKHLPVDRVGQREGIEVVPGVDVRCCDKLWSRHKADHFSGASNACPFGAAKEEEFVLDDSSTD